jgi:hypothetical protein
MRPPGGACRSISWLRNSDAIEARADYPDPRFHGDTVRLYQADQAALRSPGVPDQGRSVAQSDPIPGSAGKRILARHGRLVMVAGVPGQRPGDGLRRS